MGSKRRLFKTLAVLDIDARALGQWDFLIESIEPRNNVFCMVTQSGLKCLKILEKKQKNIDCQYLLLDHLARRGFKNIPRFIRTRFGSPYVQIDEEKFYCISDWFSGRSFNLDDAGELSCCAAEMARMHMASRGFSPPGSGKDIFLNWQSNFWNISGKIAKINSREMHDSRLKACFNDMALRALNSCRKLKDAGYRGIREKANEEMGFCHGAFNEHHVLTDNGSRVFVAGFDEWVRDIRLADLAKFILLVGDRTGWRWAVIQNIVESYDLVYPLCAAEWEIILAYLLFPFEYWQILKELAEKDADIEEITECFRKVREREDLKEQCVKECTRLVEGN